MYTIPFRHIHLDFHTSELIEGVGKDFSKKEFQDALQKAHVDSITLCAKCHHGWMYYPSKVFAPHPHLQNDLFGEMLSAAKELGLSVEAYISVGYDEKIALEHSQYLMRNADQSLDTTKDFLSPGYHQFCMNTPYLDIVCEQIRDLLTNYVVDGIFLDIVGERPCYCSSCMQEAKTRGINPLDANQMHAIWKHTYATYIKRIQQVVQSVQPGIEIFHNSGHIDRGRPDLLGINSHIELESLPTGGWGYDHFLISSRFVQPLGKPFLGMTGRFQYGWGDFGGYKHPNGLRYEVSRFLAQGAGCSIGDQMHPFGKLDPGLYRMIGQVYEEVELKQPWCTEVSSLSEIGVLSTEAAGDYAILGAGDSLKQGSSDIGAVRILQEGHYLFDVLGTQDDFTPYRLIILPDRIKGDEVLQAKLLTYIEQGGKILATGKSGIGIDGGIDLGLGVKYEGVNPYTPNYIHALFEVGPLDSDSFVMYFGSQSIRAQKDATTLAFVQEPFFNRGLQHFSSHYHTASTLSDGEAGIVLHDEGIYCGWNLFGEYALKGNLAAKYIALHLIKTLVPNSHITCSYPSQVELSVMHQKKEERYILHLISGSRVKHGLQMEVVEDFIQIPESEIHIRIEAEITAVRLVPQNKMLPFSYEKDALICTIPSFACHQMVELSYKEETSI